MNTSYKPIAGTRLKRKEKEKVEPHTDERITPSVLIH